MDREKALKFYCEWLKGYSLRELSPQAGCSHSVLRKYFRRYFGSHACNPKAASLARSLVCDHLDDPVVLEFALSVIKNPENIKHRSLHNLKQLGKYQVVTDPEFMDFLAYEEPKEPVTELRLPMVIKWLEEVLETLVDLVPKECYSDKVA